MRSFLAIAPALFLAACSASAVEEEAGSSEAEITTVDASTCPRELRLHIGYGMYLAETEPTAEGLDEREAARLAAAMKQFEDLSEGPITVEAKNVAMTAGTCTYTQAPSTTAVLRTSASGESELEITTGHLHLVAHPRRFAAEGVRFGLDDMVELSAVISDPWADGPMKLKEVGGVAVNVTGEQIARWQNLSALRVPLLQTSLVPLSAHHASYLETMVIDTEKGPARYAREVEGIKRSIDIDLLNHADPTSFQTTDPDTTICFLGPAAGVCALAMSFDNSVFGSGVEGCTATESALTLTFRGAPFVIPHCQ